MNPSKEQKKLERNGAADVVRFIGERIDELIELIKAM